MLRPLLDAGRICARGTACRRPGRIRLCAVVMLAALGFAVAFAASPVRGQTPSDVDTMRILNAAALPGDTVAVDFYLRNTNVLAGYNFRLRYDPTRIEPLCDTNFDWPDPTISVEAEQLRGNVFEVFGGNVGAPGVLTFMAVDFLRGQGPFFLPGGGVAVRMHWRVLPDAPPESTTIGFENDPSYPQSFNTTVDFAGLTLRRPVLESGVFEILTCSCGSEGDLNDDGIPFEIADVYRLIDYTFTNATALIKDPSCRHRNRGELTCDGVVDVRDVVRMILIMAGMRQPTCDPCACNPYPSGCP